ncbi:helix-turn-helix domain-containing protein, partial [Mycobacterium sp. E1386]|uniref:helix-turn-helix domain-containing protein n=2 Tax=Mycobacterium TaxID=1763 RepID=UPI000AB73217
LEVLHDQVQAASPGEPLWLPTPVDGRLRDACAMIADNLRDPLTLQQIGRRIGIGQRTLSRLFRDELAMTFPQWRTQLRLQRALVLLAERRDVTSVASECGWATASAFIDTYRRAFGHTPGRAIAKTP